MAKKDDVRSFNQIKAYPRGSAQGGRAIQAVKGNMAEYDGIDSHRTVVRETSEGRAIARTRDRMPMVEIEHLEDSLYMESGRLEFSSPGVGNPTRLDPAKWRFMDIDPSGDYLGEISASDSSLGEQAVPQPTPIDTGVLRDDIDSLAIGYMRSADGTTDYERKLAAGDKTVLKKVVVGQFPASLWSGRMRLFMQAQYGMAQGETHFRFVPTLVGSLLYLDYIGKDGQTTRLGWWQNMTPGIYLSPDGRYWFINIVSGEGANDYAIDVSPIVQVNDAAADLADELKVYRAGGSVPLPPGDVEKAEAYVMAHSEIDLSKKVRTSTFVSTSPVGSSPIAYGWHWNKNCSEASTVLVAKTGAFGDRHLTSTTAKITISYTPVEGQSPSPSWVTATLSETHHSDWMDGWGEYNLFVPGDSYVGGALELYSLAIEISGLRQDMRFSSVPVFGYYKDDAWTPLLVSCTGPLQSEYPRTEQEDSGISYCPGTDMSTPNRYQLGQTPAGVGWSYKSTTIDVAHYRSVSFGSWSFSGSSKSGFFRDVTGAYSGAGADGATLFQGPPYGIGGSLFCAMEPAPDGWAAYEPESWRETSSTPTRRTYTINAYDRFGSERANYTIVIPTGDCDAVYIATYEARNYHTETVRITTQASSTVLVTGHNFAGDFPVTPWASCINRGWFGDSNGETSPGTPPDPQPPEVGVFCFNSKIQGEQGVPASSYTTLFTVSQSYPFFDAGMDMLTSNGQRYYGTEGVKDPDSVPASPRFVGWA